MASAAKIDQNLEEVECRMRHELAAAFRLAALFGWDDHVATHMSARLPDGSFRVNADWTQAPSGSGYALADRRVLAHAIPDLYERIAPRPTTPFAQALRLALIDAAPDDALPVGGQRSLPGSLTRSMRSNSTFHRSLPRFSTRRT